MAAVFARYARAFADVVAGRKLNAGAVTRQLEQFSDTMAENRALSVVFDNPSIPNDQKIRLLDQIAQRLEFSRETRNFVAILIDQHRINHVREITDLFKQEINERLGIALAQVVTARPLSDEEKSSLEARIATRVGKRVQARYSEDPSILGGAVVTVGSTVFDGSVKGQLQALRQQIANAQ